MTLRCTSDLIRASNEAQDLTQLVYNYLILYRKYANGLNNIKITDSYFNVVFRPMRKENSISVCLVSTETRHTEITDYYDNDDDMFSEAWGSDNSCGYHVESSNYTKELYIDIPLSHLLQTTAQIETQLKQFVKTDSIKKVEASRLEEIKTLEDRIAKLKAT